MRLVSKFGVLMCSQEIKCLRKEIELRLVADFSPKGFSFIVFTRWRKENGEMYIHAITVLLWKAGANMTLDIKTSFKFNIIANGRDVESYETSELVSDADINLCSGKFCYNFHVVLKQHEKSSETRQESGNVDG